MRIALAPVVVLGALADSDFVRVDMQTTALNAPVEEFVITLEPQGDGAVLALAWEKMRAWVALAKK